MAMRCPMAFSTVRPHASCLVASLDSSSPCQREHKDKPVKPMTLIDTRENHFISSNMIATYCNKVSESLRLPPGHDCNMFSMVPEGPEPPHVPWKTIQGCVGRLPYLLTESFFDNRTPYRTLPSSAFYRVMFRTLGRSETA